MITLKARACKLQGILLPSLTGRGRGVGLLLVGLLVGVGLFSPPLWASEALSWV